MINLGAKLQQNFDICKKNAQLIRFFLFLLAYVKKKQYLCTRFQK